MQNAMVSHQVRQSLIHKRQQINALSVAYFLGLAPLSRTLEDGITKRLFTREVLNT